MTRAAWETIALACAALGAAVGGLGACTNPAKGEAASLVASVERFRRAENDGKAALLAPLEAAACADKDVCAAKEACLAYAKPTASGLVLKREVQVGLADLEQGRLERDGEIARALPEKLEEASRMLSEGRAALDGCDQKVLALKMRFGL